jgi:hypothetical protein
VDGEGLKEFLMNPQNLNRFAYGLNNPLKYVDLSGEKVEQAQKDVTIFGARVGVHRFLLLTPDNPSDFSDNPRFVKNSEGQQTTTVSGQPEGSFPNFGNLVSRPNSDINSHITERATVTSPKGESDTDFIKNILKAEASYKNNLKYEAEPKKGSSGYNSNSFNRGVLKTVGVRDPLRLGGNAPGFRKPIPLPRVNRAVRIGNRLSFQRR